MLPDVNVWLALAFEAHPQHPAARDWFNRLEEDRFVCFCRSTQVSFLRLLTQPAVLRQKALTQNEAWKIYEQFRNDSRVTFRDEPTDVDVVFRQLATRYRQSVGVTTTSLPSRKVAILPSSHSIAP